MSLTVVAVGPAVAQTSPDFALWLDGVRADAQARGVRPETTEMVLAGLGGRSARVLELDRRQPEFNEKLRRDRGNRVSEARGERSQMMLRA